LPEQRKKRGITCQEVASLATEYLEDRLPVASHKRILRHLESCAPCSTYIEQLTLVRDSLRKLPDPVMPDDVREHLFQRLARIARERGGSA
jgi:anti-sigma factor RsiW